jgi:hypothetical protein
MLFTSYVFSGSCDWPKRIVTAFSELHYQLQYIWHIKLRKIEVDEACGTHGRKEESVQGFGGSLRVLAPWRNLVSYLISYLEVNRRRHI